MTQIAAQLYTLRDFCKTPLDIATTLARVSKIGYRAVQASALGPIAPQELKKILDDNGLTCCATHSPLDRMKNDTKAMIDEHKVLGCEYVALGGLFPKAEESNEATWTRFIGEFNDVAKKLSGSGLRLGYHNHSHEFAPLTDDAVSRRPWDLLVEKLDREIFFEVDTYWVQHGGGDAAAWIEKLGGRVPCVHLKDMGISREKTHQMREVGRGNMNWDGILAACRKAGAKWYIVEQDHTNGRDAFECLAASLEFLKGKGLS